MSWPLLGGEIIVLPSVSGCHGSFLGCSLFSSPFIIAHLFFTIGKQPTGAMRMLSEFSENSFLCVVAWFCSIYLDVPKYFLLDEHRLIRYLCLNFFVANIVVIFNTSCFFVCCLCELYMKHIYLCVEIYSLPICVIVIFSVFLVVLLIKENILCCIFASTP